MSVERGPDSANGPVGVIYLVGFMCTGKTTVGQLLAERLGCEWLDTDESVTSLTGLTPAEAFELHGEEWFRDRESDALRREVSSRSRRKKDSCERLVVSTGGGIVLRRPNVEFMRSTGVVVWLMASEDDVMARLDDGASRPALAGSDTRLRVRELLSIRTPLYAAAAHLAVDTGRTDAAGVCDAIERALASGKRGCREHERG